MKTKVSQKEWNDKRDAFLCAYVTALAGQEGGLNMEWALAEANTLTSELYDVEEDNAEIRKENLKWFEQSLSPELNERTEKA